MTKADLIQTVAAHGMTKKAAGEMVDALFATIGKTIKKEGRFFFPGFGTWTVRQRKARKGRNPQTGAEIEDQGVEDRRLQAGEGTEERPVRAGCRPRASCLRPGATAPGTRERPGALFFWR